MPKGSSGNKSERRKDGAFSFPFEGCMDIHRVCDQYTRRASKRGAAVGSLQSCVRSRDARTAFLCYKGKCIRVGTGQLYVSRLRNGFRHHDVLKVSSTMAMAQVPGRCFVFPLV